jgi:hypothetical protein
MTSGRLHRATTQRSISASSRSSISSKWRLAMPSLLKGHSLSEGCSLGEAGGRNSRCILGNFDLLACVPSGSIEHQQDAPSIVARSDFSGEVLQSQRENVGVDRGQDQLVDLPGFRAHEGVEVSPLVTLVDLHRRPFGLFAHGAPHFADDRLAAQAVLIFAL